MNPMKPKHTQKLIFIFQGHNIGNNTCLYNFEYGCEAFELWLWTWGFVCTRLKDSWVTKKNNNCNKIPSKRSLWIGTFSWTQDTTSSTDQQCTRSSFPNSLKAGTWQKSSTLDSSRKVPSRGTWWAFMFPISVCWTISVWSKCKGLYILKQKHKKKKKFNQDTRLPCKLNKSDD